MPEDKETFEHVNNFVFDLDSTVWCWNSLLPGVKETIQKLKAKGKNIYFATNNSVFTRKGFAEKLGKMGINTSPDHIVSSAYSAARTFSRKGIEEVYAIGEEGLKKEIRDEDVKLSEEADHVIAAIDRNFTFWKLSNAAEMIRDGAKFWGTGDGINFETEEKVIPGDKPILEAIRISSLEEDYERVGKPSVHMVRTFREEFDLEGWNTALIGDNAASDIEFGNKLNFKTGLMLGGETDKEEVADLPEEQRPDLVFTEFSRILRKV